MFEEQSLIYGNSELSDVEAILKMECLERFIKETMRLFPVITIIGRQLSDDIIISKYVC